MYLGKLHLETTWERGSSGPTVIGKKLEMRYISGPRTLSPDSRAINVFFFIIFDQLGRIELVRNLGIANT